MRNNPTPSYKKPYKVLAMHDMCGYGRSSLTAVQTILPSLNCQVCPLPTALLSNHFGFSVLPSFINLGDELKKFVPLWQELKLNFDCFYSGYLASPDQVEIAITYINQFDPEFIFVDPVLGDNAKLYHGFNLQQVEAMKNLVAYAHAISPNVTEACFILGLEPVLQLTADKAKTYLEKLARLGPTKVVITGSPSNDGTTITSYAFDVLKGEFYSCSSQRVNLDNLHGTGDSFASVLVGLTLQGFSLDVALRRVVSYLSKCAVLAQEFESELCLEPPLDSLIAGSESCSFELFSKQ